MSYHHFREPLREEYDTEEEYQDAVKMWEWAEEEFVDEYLERVREERENN